MRLRDATREAKSYLKDNPQASKEQLTGHLKRHGFDPMTIMLVVQIIAAILRLWRS